MEKRYYFRGLGLGIIVTAVIMGIALSGSRQRKITDDEVIARAKALGMIEDSRLLTPAEGEESDTNEAGGQENKEAAKPETVKEPVKKDVAVAEPKPAENSGDTSETEQPSAQESEAADAKPAEDVKPSADTKPAADTNEMKKQDEDAPKTSAAMKSVTIVSGDGSFTVAKKLAEAGVVNSAAAFDTFLCENGYDKRLRTGTFQIPADAGDEQIARIMTGQE